VKSSGGRGSGDSKSGPQKAPSAFQVARTGDAVYVRVLGLGSMHNAPVLKEFVDAMLKEGFRRFVIDLESCRGVDSTFMGTLLDVATTAREGARPQSDSNDGEAGVFLVNVDDHCQKQLQSVGLDTFIPIHQGEARMPAGLELRTLEMRDVSSPERLKLILKAHQELVAIDARNKEKFGSFLEELLKDLGPLGPSDLTDED
jgi:anti-anti-sigma regulatory factor